MKNKIRTVHKTRKTRTDKNTNPIKDTELKKLLKEFMKEHGDVLRKLAEL